MTTLGPRAAGTAPLPAPLRINLISSVGAEPADSGRWQTGIAYKPYNYLGDFTLDPCGEVGEGVKTLTDMPETVEWDPYILGAGSICSTLGTTWGDLEARARLRLENSTSHILEGVLWTNTIDGADFGASHPNVSLSDASVPTSPTAAVDRIYTPNAYDTFPLVKSFSDMVAALGELLGGYRGMIHVEARVIPYLSFYGLAVASGNRLITTLGDHIVVPGTGYTGSDPEGNESSPFHTWIYGTSMVEVLLSEIMVPPDRVTSVDRENNDIEVYAERMALAHWDRQAHIGIPVCLEDPAGDCSDAGS